MNRTHVDLILVALCCFILAHLSFSASAAITPTGKTWSEGELETGADGERWTNLSPGNTPVVGQYGYQPVGTTNAGDPDLIYNFNSILQASYQGFFTVGTQWVTPHPEIGGLSEYNAVYDYSADGYGTGIDAALTFHENGTSFFISGAGGAYNGEGGLTGGEQDSITELSIPTLIKPANPNNRAGVQTATQLQPWAAPFRHSLVENYGFHSITGMFYDDVTDKLCVLGIIDYDNFPYTQDNMLCYRTPSNLATSIVDGFYGVKSTAGSQIPGTEAAHAATWMADVPTAWRAALGGRILWGGGKNGSIFSRSTAGPSLFVGTIDGIGTSGTLTVTRHMDFWDQAGKILGAHYFPNRETEPLPWYVYEMFNCDRTQSSYRCDAANDPGGEGITQNAIAWINDWMTITTYAHQGFIIPGTDTYAVVGQMAGGEDGIVYKGNPPYINGGAPNGSNHCSGPCRNVYEDVHNKYWLFDLSAITSATNHWEIFPYEHGYITFLDQFQNINGDRSIMRNATFDLQSGRLAVVMTGRGGAEPFPEADIVIFENAGWAE